MNRQGGQTLRFPGYPQQAPPPARNTPLGSGRLQNSSKISNTNGTSWGFGAPNGTPGLANRQTGTGGASFAQSIGGGHSAAPLDMSEFPSLSGNPQPQYQNQTNNTTNNAIWQQRQTQQTPVQRPPQQAQNTTAQQHQPPNPQHPASPSNDDMFMGSSNLQGSLDDYRQTNQTNQGQIPGTRQPPTQVVDDFPPLGRNGTDGNHNDQKGGFGAFSGQALFSPTHKENQPLHALPTGFGNPPESTRASSIAERTPGNFGTIANSRSPTEHSRPSQTPTNDITSLLSNFSSNRTNTANHQQPPLSDFDNRIPDIPPQQKTEDMSESDRWGLGGFLARIRSEDPLVSGLARGQDLTTLGLNLNSPEPLWPTWNGPFADPNSRPLQPDFTLPECYTVTNVHRVREKLPGFTDETLFWIFYTQPRDILQELAASELTNRNWRYHKQHQMWLTKDATMPEPRRLSDDMERGSYVFFNHRQWEKVHQTDFHLEYALLAPTSGRANGGA